MSNLREVITTLLAVCLIRAFTLPAIADVPGWINYQGKLTNDGSPADGSYEMHFYIYDALIDGTLLWDERQTVSFVEGIYTVQLGVNGLLDSTIFNDGLTWLVMPIRLKGKGLRPFL